MLGNLPANPNASIYGHQFEVRAGRASTPPTAHRRPLGDEAPPVPPGEGPPRAGAGAELSGSPPGGAGQSGSTRASPGRPTGSSRPPPRVRASGSDCRGAANAGSPAAAARPGDEAEPATPPSPLAGAGAAQPARGEAQPGFGNGGGGGRDPLPAITGARRGRVLRRDRRRGRGREGCRCRPAEPTGVRAREGAALGRGAGLGPVPLQPLVGAPGPAASGASPSSHQTPGRPPGQSGRSCSATSTFSWLVGRRDRLVTCSAP